MSRPSPTRSHRRRTLAWIARSLLAGALGPGALAAQDTAWTTMAAGPHYAAGGIKRFFFGSDYRPLWVASVRAPYLDLGTEVGGLVPTTAGGGMQTKSLWFRGADGFDYGFRSIDKSLGNMPPALAGTFVERLALDQTSAQHPAAPAIAAALSEAAGLLYTRPKLVVLPDDPRLGEHRERFKNTIGYFERRATIPAGAPGFAGAKEIIRSVALLARLRAGPADRADAITFLKARLFDLMIGDRDRHRGQWTWARFDDQVPRLWVPIPEDRDQAFVRFDGLVLWATRGMTGQIVNFEAGALLNFDEGYSHIVGSTWSGRELDRRLLVALERPVWDSVVRDLQTRLTDEAIARAVGQMPPEYQVLDGETLARRLRARRDRLPQVADQFYRLLAEEVELQATDGADLIVIEPAGEAGARVSLAARDRPDAPYYGRTFAADETREVRLRLHDGADSVVVRGTGDLSLHIVGGGGAVVVDSSRSASARLYSPARTDRVVGRRRLPVDRRAYRPPVRLEEGEIPPRDWGHQWDPLVVLGAAPDLGLVLGGGPRYIRYGFWKYPYAYAVEFRAGAATGPMAPAADLKITTYRRNSRVRGELYLRGSGLSMLRYHGLGNDVALTEPDAYYRVTQRQFEATPSALLPLGPRGWLRFGPTLRYQRTPEDTGRIIAATQPYGSGSFGQLGGLAEVGVDTRPRGLASRRGAALVVSVRAFPAAWSVDSGFVSGRAEGVAHLGTDQLPLAPVLALRAGGKIVSGPYPFHEAAFIGGPETVRLGRQNRYGGDAAVWGNAELRLRLGTHRLVLPGEIGISGLADAGRVFLEGETSDTWHTAYGGGLWLTVLDPGNVLSAQLARTPERTVVYFRFGFAY